MYLKKDFFSFKNCLSFSFDSSLEKCLAYASLKLSLLPTYLLVYPPSVFFRPRISYTPPADGMESALLVTYSTFSDQVIFSVAFTTLGWNTYIIKGLAFDFICKNSCIKHFHSFYLCALSCKVMKAKFKTTCSECNAPIKVGEEISKSLSGKWVHKYCAPDSKEFP